MTAENPLGKQTEYIDTYSPSLLFPIARIGARVAPVTGIDIWNAYELSWLDLNGKPVVAVGEFRIPALGSFLIESKSFKLYLNSFNQTRFESREVVQEVMVRDLSQAAGVTVSVRLDSLDRTYPAAPDAVCIDDLTVVISDYQPTADLLCCASDEVVEELLCSHLLKSNCPVTGQPDWGSLYIGYSGARIDHEGLLAYVVSMRQHQGFHEQCVEQIYSDLMERCAPRALWVYARYVRRGGLDINPFRASHAEFEVQNFRLPRQ